MEKTVLETLRQIKLLLEIRKNPSLEKLNNFVSDFYAVKNMPKEFYELLSNNLKNTSLLKLLKVVATGNIYKLISYLKMNDEETIELEEYLSPQEYFSISKRYINKLVKALENMNQEENELNKVVSEELIWKLRRRPTIQSSEYQEIAYKLYQAFGYDNAIELISQKYGHINYEQLHYMIKNLEPTNITPGEQQIFRTFLFGDKKDYNVPIRQMLNGRNVDLFLNIDYFYNNLPYFISKLGTKIKVDRLTLLLKERFLTSDPTTPEITGELKEDIISSYYHKFSATDTSQDEVVNINTNTYINKLRNKYSSSIPQIPLKEKGNITPELLSLSDPRNLTHGYRSGNCFRINGDASILFSKFLDSEHMRILSFSTPEYKDYAMVLLMRNGNVLIAQGIETSKWAPSELKGKALYELTKETLKQIMDYMNENGDDVVATIIGATNQHVSMYNNQILPFLVSPILDNSSNYYNGISSYQCLLDLAPNKTIKDMKTYEPQKRYLDKREEILSRQRNYPNQEIERRIISLRYQRTQTDERFSFYTQMLNKHEQETICNKDWYITMFTDGTIDSFISDTTDPRAKEEYEQELGKVYKKCYNKNQKTGG